jgi:4-hydroxysphinganine ceramide fatty acyl 2-hydroxylase
MFDHPGGEELILQWGGKDIEEAMKDPLCHTHSDAAYVMLKDYYIGDLIGVPSSFLHDPSSTFLDLKKPLFFQMLNSKISKNVYLEQVHIPRHTIGSPPIFGNSLEPLTMTPWWVIPMVWGSVVSYLFWNASQSFSYSVLIPLYLIGFTCWTLVEFVFHRFLFHMEKLLPNHPWALTFHFMIHGIHHFIPMDR